MKYGTIIGKVVEGEVTQKVQSVNNRLRKVADGQDREGCRIEVGLKV